MLSVSTGEGSIHAQRYPDEVKELAYQVWAFVAGRDAKKTHAILTAGEHGDPIDVSYQAVAYWAREHAWAERAARDVQSIAPDLRHQAFSELLFAGLDGARYLRRVAAGQEDEPDVSTIPKSDDPEVNYDRMMAKVASHDRARKARIQASIAAVDRIGFSPVGKGSPSVSPPTPAGRLSVGELTDDALSQMEQHIGSGRS